MPFFTIFTSTSKIGYTKNSALLKPCDLVEEKDGLLLMLNPPYP
jgi:hypothetical protein